MEVVIFGCPLFLFCYGGIFLCEVVDALSNIRRCGGTCIELCTLTYVVCFIKNVAQSYNIGKAQ